MSNRDIDVWASAPLSTDVRERLSFNDDAVIQELRSLVVR